MEGLKKETGITEESSVKTTTEKIKEASTRIAEKFDRGMKEVLDRIGGNPYFENLSDRF